MEQYLLSFLMAMTGVFFLAMSFLCLDTLPSAGTIAMRLADVLLLFLMPMIAGGLFSLSFYTLFLS